ncbi:MAG: type II secretion system F family protein [Xanthomonadales bacterium]|nr:type II secretion system F family protein [Xanthomonadales bacterium]
MANNTTELEVFLWEGRDKRGKKLKGQQTGRNQNLIRADLRRQGITPTRVRRKPKALFGAAGRRITAKEIAIFSRQFATMLKSGVPLVGSLEIIEHGSANPRMAKMIGDIRRDIESGSTLAEALAKHPVQFDELYQNLVNAGEQAGVLDGLLESIASYKERMESIKGKIKKALFYPAAVIAVAFLVSGILLVFVIPMFEETFQSFGADLPAFTRFIVDISRSVRDYGLLYFLVIAGTIAGLLYFKKRSLAFQHWIDRVSLKIPIIGSILQKAALARFARTLATTFAAGVPLVDALKIVSKSTGNAVYNAATAEIREDVAVGHTLKLAMEQTGVFPHMVIQMTAIGEEAGSLDDMLNKVGDFYEEEVNDAVDAMSSLIEPMVIVIIGGMVGSMVIGMYLPIFKLAAVM